jgi:hypothetical protein
LSGDDGLGRCGTVADGRPVAPALSRGRVDGDGGAGSRVGGRDGRGRADSGTRRGRSVAGGSRCSVRTDTSADEGDWADGGRHADDGSDQSERCGRTGWTVGNVGCTAPDGELGGLVHGRGRDGWNVLDDQDAGGDWVSDVLTEDGGGHHQSHGGSEDSRELHRGDGVLMVG